MAMPSLAGPFISGASPTASLPFGPHFAGTGTLLNIGFSGDQRAVLLGPSLKRQPVLQTRDPLHGMLLEKASGALS